MFAVAPSLLLTGSSLLHTVSGEYNKKANEQNMQETQSKRKHLIIMILWILWGKVVVSKLGGHCYELTTVTCIELTSGKCILKLNLVLGLSISFNQR